MRLGPACLASFPLRNPLVFAYEWASLDRIAEGRTVLIVCAGGGSAGDWDAEARAVGVPVDERQRRLEEHVTILRRLWSEDDVTHRGQFFQFERVTLEPKPLQQPCPIWLANNPWTIRPEPRPDRARAPPRRAVRRRLADPQPLARRSSPSTGRRSGATRGRKGGIPTGSGNCYYHNINVNEDREAALAETKRFLDLYYSADYTRARIEAWTAFGSPEECAENLRRFRGTGMQRITLRLTAWDQVGQLERVIREVLPRVNR